jgi:hypothetical protein
MGLTQLDTELFVTMEEWPVVMFILEVGRKISCSSPREAKEYDSCTSLLLEFYINHLFRNGTINLMNLGVDCRLDSERLVLLVFGHIVSARMKIPRELGRH